MKISLTESQIRALSEVLRDDLPTYMRDIVSKRYQNSDEYLNMDVPKHTDKIPNVKVEVTNKELTNRINSDLVNHFTQNIIKQFQNTGFYNIRHSAPDIFDELLDLIKKSLGINVRLRHLDNEDTPVEKTDADYVKSIAWLYTKEFKLPTPESTDINNPIFGKNKSGFATFLKVSKKTFPELGEAFDTLGSDGWDFIMDEIINDKKFVGLRQPIVNYLDNVKKLQTGKLYLYITDKPDDKLRMSLSRYYDSCQNLYSGGDTGTDQNKKLLSNVFDVNSKVAYLIYDTPFKDSRGNEHPFTSVARTIIRVNDSGGIMFDAVYPYNMEDEFYKIIEDETGLKNVGKRGDTYHYKKIKGLPSPYMDRYKIKTINKGEFNLSEKPEVIALQKVIGIDDVDQIEETGDNVFSYDGETWVVDTYESAIEYTKDYLLDTFEDMNQESEIKKLLDWRVFHINSILSLYSITEDDLEEMGYGTGVNGLVDYLNDSGIVKFMDLRISGSWGTWVRRNLNMDDYIKYFGGEWEAMEWALAKYDGILYEEDGYYIYRFDN
jgi:hypothetical protein